MTMPDNDPNEVQQTPEMTIALEEMLYGHADIPSNPNNLASELSPEDQARQNQVVRELHASDISAKQHEMEKILVHEEIRPSSHVDGFDFSAAAMAALTFTIIVGLALFAQQIIANMEKKPAPTGVVIERAAEVPAPRVPEPTPAYPTVQVQTSSDPNQAPSPLPPGDNNK